MKINIVNYEVANPWILSKIANKLKDSLQKLGHEVTLSKEVNLNADINHHITFHSYQGLKQGLHTLMITHVDNHVKLKKISEDLKTAKVGICMSKSTMVELIRLGIPKEQLQFAHSAHDGLSKPRKIALGFTTRLYADGRKREDYFSEAMRIMSPNDFRFEIMGYGWTPQVGKMRKEGFEVNYFEEFDYDEYMKLLSRLDYYLYLGNDEGSMGFIDALAAGVKTIVQPQGFHLDAPNGITHSFTNSDEFINIIQNLITERKIRTDSVSQWTWENYAKKHLLIWDACLRGDNMDITFGTVKMGNPLEREKQNIRLTKLLLFTNFIKQKTQLILNLRKRNSFPAGPRFFGPKSKNK
jgi:hypothetical protein